MPKKQERKKSIIKQQNKNENGKIMQIQTSMKNLEIEKLKNESLKMKL